MIEVACDRYSRTAEILQAELDTFDDLDGVINWEGRQILDCPQPILNAYARTDKLAQLIRLGLKGVAVPPFSMAWQEGYIPRTRHHQQGRDFTEYVEGDYWVKKLLLEDEWRLHFFRTKKGNIKLLRSGIKLPKTLRAHPWVKSHRLGWKISYVGGAPGSLVEQGRAAIDALALDFGAVDAALTQSVKPVVLEVNTCPGLERGTLEKYVEAIVARLS